jgi:hypothetical protein
MIKTKVDAIFALDRLKQYEHAKDCYTMKTKKFDETNPCNCGALLRNDLIEEIQQFIKSKK